MMKYICAKWHHNSNDDPILLYSELDGDHWEVRKVEIFRDGRKGWASHSEETELTGLGQVPVPPLDEIRADPEFEVWEIAEAEFEEVWRKRAQKV